MEFWVLDLIKSAFNQDGYADFDVVGDRTLGLAEVCPHCNTPLGPKPWQPPYSMKVNGSRIGDICSSGHGREFLVSPRFLDIWNGAGFEGLEIIGDEVGFTATSSDAPIPCGLTVVRYGHALTRLDHEKSGMVVHKRVGCVECDVSQIPRLQCIRVVEESWDGRDIFAPSGLYGSVLVTRRVVEATRSNALSNVHFVHQDDYFRSQDYS